VREHELQKQIVDALHLAGFEVMETTAYRQKGPTGVDKGIPDLLVSHKILPVTFLGIEVKLPGKIKWSSLEQSELWERGRFHVAQSPEQAVEQASKWLESFLRWPFANLPAEDVRSAVSRTKRALEALR
jgi:hypothetical protein